LSLDRLLNPYLKVRTSGIRRNMRYVLVTSARNEAKFIEVTIRSVVNQSLLPERWVIVDDGSTDDTAGIVEHYRQDYQWIQLLRRPNRPDRSFTGKALAVNSALEQLASVLFDVVGNLDADVSFGPDYMAFLLEKFAVDPELGVAGTPYTEKDYDSGNDSFAGDNYVSGPCQLFRYACFQEIGGYAQSRSGGIDWIAVMQARMNGWKARSFPEKRFHHHRPMGTAEKGKLAALFAYGQKDYYLGGSPIWQLFRVAYRAIKKPYVSGGLALLLGFGWAAMRRVKRPVSAELVRFHRRDQMQKLKAILWSLGSLKKVHSFSLGAGVRNKREAFNSNPY
jgi:biofilm PGA synthesis N-glycosyltransferase PgaC